MSDNFHTPWEDGTTEYRSADMNTPLGELDAAISQAATGIYDVGGCYEAKPIASQVLLRYPIPRTVTFAADMVLSQMKAAVAATGVTVFTLKKNGVGFATASFSASGNSATFSGSETTFNAGDILTLESPAAPDATLENLSWSFVASRVVIS